MHEPDAFLRVPHEVRRELRRDDHVDALAVCLGQIEQPPEKRLRENPRAGIPLERHGDAVRLVAARTQLVDEGVAEDLRAAPRERHLGLTTAIRIVALVLRVAKHDHLCLEPVDLLLQVVDEAKRSGVERALVIRERLDVPTHRLPENRLDRRSDPATHART